ncbi:MAG TPA: hypothetical protein VKJ01_23230, partial [Candidatus Solibacter sp.]|nr:hypothetical protein [Candidatus Solibacter sp.]
MREQKKLAGYRAAAWVRITAALVAGLTGASLAATVDFATAGAERLRAGAGRFAAEADVLFRAADPVRAPAGISKWSPSAGSEECWLLPAKLLAAMMLAG